MVPEIQKFLIQGSELLASRRGDIETLLNYLDKNLIVLKERLNEENFERILTIIWESSAQTLAETIQYNIDVSNCISYSILFYCLELSFYFNRKRDLQATSKTSWTF